jgi:putative ABC transport system permease protein
LQAYAYRTGIGLGLFVLSGFAAWAVAGLTVGWQALRSARANPVESLRYE